MSDEEGQELVTKPFKFVTGKEIIPLSKKYHIHDPRLTNW